MKPIGISTEFLQPGKVGGAEFFLKNLIAGFREILGEKPLHLFGPRGVAPVPSQTILEVPAGIAFGNRFIRETWSHVRNAGSVSAILYPNYFTPPGFKSSRVVTVIHDAQYRHLPDNFSARKRTWLKAAHWHTLLRADKVVAISEFVKQDLLEIHGNRWADKIEVIPNPVSWGRFNETANEVALPSGRFILSVAAHYPHKNLITLIHAFRKVLKTFPEAKLVLAGQLPENLIGTARKVDLRKTVKALGLESAVTITGHITDAGLGELYRRADLFVFPSLFEGFGLPPVEALGFGLPVITTSMASLPEVTLGMAKYVKDPYSFDELAALICEVLGDPASFRQSEDGMRRIREAYAPASIAKRYLKVLNG